MYKLNQFAAALLCAFILISPAFSQDHQNITRLDNLYEHWDYGYDITLQDTLAFVACGFNGVLVIDISDPEHPEYVCSFGEHYISCTKIGVYDDLVFTGNGPYIYDKSDMNAIELLSTIEGISMNNADFYYKDGVLFISTGQYFSPMYAVNVMDPENPRIISEFEICRNSPGFFAAGNSLFCLIDFRDIGWLEIDISNPLDPVPIDTVYFDNCFVISLETVHAEDNRVYISSHNGLWIFELDENLDIADSVFFEDENFRTITSMAIKDNILLGTAGGSVILYDVSDIYSVEYLGTVFDYRRINTLQIRDDLLYTFSHDAFLIADIANPAEPRVISTIRDYHHRIHNFDISGDLGLFLSTDSSCRIMDLGDPAAIYENDSCYLGYKPQEIKIIEDGFITTRNFDDEFFGFEIFDSQDNGRYDRACSFRLDQPETYVRYSRIEVIDETAFILEDNTSRLYAADISDRSSPEIINITDFGTHRNVNFHKLGEDQLIMTSDSSLFILDVEDPSSPQRIAEFVIETDYSSISARDFAIRYPYVYLTVGESHDIILNKAIRVIDISDMENFFEVAQYDLQLNPMNSTPAIKISGDYAVISHWSGGFEVLNIVDPQNIHPVGYYDTPGYTENFQIEGNIIYILNSVSVGVYDFSQAMSADDLNTSIPTSLILHPAFPNPFNDRASVSFNLPVSSEISLTLYNMAGRMVRDLSPTGSISAGKRHVTIHGGDLVSGVYFLRLENQTCTRCQKLIYLR